MRFAKILLIAFILTALLHLLGEWWYSSTLQTFTKPLLLPLLAAYFLFAVRFQFSRFNTAIVIGLLFSFLGDVLLLLAADRSELFIFGLLSFLMTHFCYLFAFLSYLGAKRGYVFQNLWIILPFLVFLIGYNAFLLPGIPSELHFPVSFYSLAIITMSVSALNLRTLISHAAFVPLFSGALLFVASDSILAFNKFQDKIQIPYVGFFIMLTYILGQYFIVRGAVQMNSRSFLDAQ